MIIHTSCLIFNKVHCKKKNHTWPKKLSMCRSMYVFFIHGLQTVIHGTHAEKGRVLPCVLAMYNFFLQCMHYTLKFTEKGIIFDGEFELLVYSYWALSTNDLNKWKNDKKCKKAKDALEYACFCYIK